MSGQLYYGDNPNVLRNQIAGESVDLIYLDPPFNSNASYNLLFKSPDGNRSHAQIDAFEDTWHWTDEAEFSFDAVVRGEHSQAAIMLRAMRSALGDNDMMAYLAMMAVRLVELHRVLKPTGTLYLHCDPTASHYLKIVMDGIFGIENYRNEISWRRSQPKSHTTVNFPNCRDIILRYAKTDKAKFFKVYGEHDPEYIEKFYRHVDADGRRYRLGDLTNPNKNRPNLTYEFLGVTRVWRWTKERMQRAFDSGLVYQSKSGAVPQMKRYLEDMQGQPISDDWDDIEHLHGGNSESMGYPTQKPLALLERIIMAGSQEGDTVLDPFCGCGTATHAAQKLNRNWIGIDITNLAIALIEKRITEAFPAAAYEVHGLPQDIEGAAALAEADKHEFQKWIVPRIGGQLYKGGQKGMDRGIDGYLHFRDGNRTSQFAIISVKGGRNVNSGMIRDLKGTVEREQAQFGVFVTLADPSREMIREAASTGIYETAGQKVPKLQIITIEQIMNGKRPQVPFNHTEGLRSTKRERTEIQGELLGDLPKVAKKRRTA